MRARNIKAPKSAPDLFAAEAAAGTWPAGWHGISRTCPVGFKQDGSKHDGQWYGITVVCNGAETAMPYNTTWLHQLCKHAMRCCQQLQFGLTSAGLCL